MHNIPEEVLNKISKCLALANGLNATQGEVAAAMAAAKKIANAYQIDVASIDWQGNTALKPTLEATKDGIKFRAAKEQMYHRYIYWTLTDCYGVRFCGNKYRQTIIGEKTDVAICKMLFPWLEDLFFKSHWNMMKKGLVQDNAADRRGVYAGFARGLIRTNAKAEENLTADEKGTLAMVVRDKKQVVDDYFNEEYGDNVKTRKDLSRHMSADAYQLGIVEGRKINFNGVTAGKGTAQLTA